ncbi:hypothetical protein IWW36_001337 [Coemansia brasiliensis]|uniref:RPEL repeat protein n=1 Tax=Coemansia brasiliensis TaxID=2650707 RepID=A0A9W8I9D7_9FUNG|nr:hypothetical protein IWW36_001337 [Coemansia brasiliensis]
MQSVDEQPISPLSEDEKATLAKRIASRPPAKELVEHNVLKDSKLDPSLQAKEVELERNLLEDKLEKKLERRPTRQDLIEQHVLLNTSAAPALQAKQVELQMNMREDNLEKKLLDRPPREKLVEQKILNEDEL